MHRIATGCGRESAVWLAWRSQVRSIAFHPTDPSILASGGEGGKVRLWRWEDEKVLQTLSHDDMVRQRSAMLCGPLLSRVPYVPRAMRLYVVWHAHGHGHGHARGGVHMHRIAIGCGRECSVAGVAIAGVIDRLSSDGPLHPRER